MAAKSLKGKRIVITRGSDASKEWESYLRKCGALALSFPTIELSPAAPTKKLAHALSHLAEFDWIAFTSAAGPHAMRDLMKHLSLKLPKNGMPRIAAIGEGTARAVRAIGCQVAFIPSKADSGTLARELEADGSGVLLLRADIASKLLPKSLAARGARVADIAVYKTKILREKPDPQFARLLAEQKIDCITFASSSAVRGFSARVGKSGMKNARRILAVAIGARAASAARAAGFSDIRTAREATIESVADAILGR